MIRKEILWSTIIFGTAGMLWGLNTTGANRTSAVGLGAVIGIIVGIVVGAVIIYKTK